MIVPTRRIAPRDIVDTPGHRRIRRAGDRGGKLLLCPRVTVGVGGATVTTTWGCTVTVAVALLVESATLVARIVTVVDVVTAAGQYRGQSS